MTPVLLHVCCGPCAAGAVPQLRAQGFEPSGYFRNPNIHPAREWLERLGGLETYADVEGFPIEVEPHYDIRGFLAEVGSLEGPERCGRCFAMRLDAAAEGARRKGIAQFTTTLLVSPYQDRDLLCEVGHAVGRRRGVMFLDTDLRAGFRGGQRRAAELGIHRQSYCGCIFSEEERHRERLARERAKWESDSRAP